MDLKFFLNQDILSGCRQFFKEVLDINIAPALSTEIKIQEFLKDHLTDTKLLSKVIDSRIIGLINDLSVKGDTTLIDTSFVLKNPSDDYDMLMVFGIDIDKNVHLTKTDISRITRALNRRSFSRPVVVLIRYGNFLSFSAAERGAYNTTAQKREKVGRISILKDINTLQVHSGHERILLQLRIDSQKVISFKDLYEKWQDVFNLKTLNAEFYKNIADWYFWATKIVKFPIDHYKLKSTYNKKENELQTEANQIALIRFLTRIIFVWFLKSKSTRIVPEEIFDKESLKKHLKFNDEFESNYYKAILQNLFFASFNTKIDSEQRTFTSQKRSTFLENRYRYASLFKNPAKSVKELFSNIPFLNGGLFSNLDYKENNKSTIRVDWFSDPDPDKKFRKNELYFPDFLFFDTEHEEDLSDFYDSHCKQKVKGLILILKEYYFTIEENTPLEQEIALDPELLGKIFENLLASYNPETRTTARKSTGSYYTPRDIVNYMVDESLIAYLKSKLTEKILAYQQLGDQQTNFFGNEGRAGQFSLHLDLSSTHWVRREDELENKLRQLFSYDSEENPFADDNYTTNAIITYLSECKILDPACGSGAFPMGVLHQIVHALKKLDQDNEQWKKLQYERLIAPEVAKITNDISVAHGITSEEARKLAENQLKHELDELLENFSRHDHNYTRKLHLIQECIYGVDIQPIAIHISKLRFFISLLVDQNMDFSQREKNYLLNSLPNLETKFVAGNSLIPLNPTGQLKTRQKNIIEIENRIKAERKKYFDCKSREEKIKIENTDAELRLEFAGKLKELTELSKNNLQIQIQKIEDDVAKHQTFKMKAQSNKDIDRINKGIDQLKKSLEKLKTQYLQFASGDDVADKILNFNPYDANTSAPFFDPEIMFALQPDEQAGFFDIILGNPPYICAIDLKKQLSESAYKKLKENYITAKGTVDLFIYFFERGINLCKHKGMLTYISPNRYLSASYGEALRDFIYKNTNIFNIVDLSNIRVFEEASVYPVITSLIKTPLSEKYIISIGEYTQGKKISNSKHISSDRLNMFDGKMWGYLLNEKIEISEKIIKQNVPLADACIINATSTASEADEYHSLINEVGGYKLINTGTIDKYKSLWGIYKLTDKKQKFLKPFLPQNSKIISSNRHRLYSAEKIIIAKIGLSTEAFYDESGEYASINTNCMHSFKTGFDPRFVLAWVNSNLFQYVFECFFDGLKMQGGYLLYSAPNLLKMSIMKATDNVQSKFHILSKEVELADESTVYLIIKKIDIMFYKLYSLTYQECLIVDREIEKLIPCMEYERKNLEELSTLNFNELTSQN